MDKNLPRWSIIVGDYWGFSGAEYYTGLLHEGKFTNPIIINGRLYYKVALSNSQTAGPYMCVGLLTGETI